MMNSCDKSYCGDNEKSLDEHWKATLESVRVRVSGHSENNF